MKKNNMVHIGLGKTATTTLQKYVLSQISSLRPGVIYNDPELIRLIDKHRLINLTSEELSCAKKILSEHEHLISRESLVDWNPRNWKNAADRNLEIFGAKTHIVITVRETISYLTSVYQQMVHQGNVCTPENFFVSSEEYELLSELLPRKSLIHFDVDSFDLAYLTELYEERFSQVSIVPIEEMPKLAFLKQHFDLNEYECKSLQQKFVDAPKINVAYSELAMTLTIKRENILNKLGLKSKDLGTDINEYISLVRDEGTVENKNTTLVRFQDLPLRKKICEFPAYVIQGLPTMVRWRFLMQGIVNRFGPYKKFRINEQCYRNYDLEEKNDSFIAKHINH